MSTNVQIKRSTTNTSPNTLLSGELAYSFTSNTLFVGSPSNTAINIGGLTSTANGDSTLVRRYANGAIQISQADVLVAPTANSHVATKQYVDTQLQSASDAYNQANAAFDQANAAYAQANTARNTANTAYVAANSAADAAANASALAGAAYGQAEFAYSIADLAYGQANVATIAAESAYNQSNDAYTQANTARNTANDAYTAANNRVLKSGDTMSGTLVLNAPDWSMNIANNVYVGNGRIGFGTTQIDHRLDVVSDEVGGAAAHFRTNNSVSSQIVKFGRFDDLVESAVSYDASKNAIVFGTTSDHPLALYSDNAEAIRIATNQMVGIQIESPTSNLHVGGNANITVGLITPNINATTINVATLLSSNGINVISQVQTAIDSANVAHDQANASYAQANAAYNQANSAYTEASTAHTAANNAANTANSAYAQANAARNQANTAYGQANDAYSQANAAYGQADFAYSVADLAYGQANAAYSQANGAANTVRVSVNSNSTLSNKQLNFVNTTTTLITISDGSDGNANIAISVVGGGAIGQAYDQANAARDQANSAYDAANNRVLKAGDMMTGNLNVAATLITQNIVPNLNVTYDIGTPEKRFKDLYLSGNTIYLGDTVISANADETRANTFNAATAFINGGLNVLDQANTARGTANSAYGQANAAYGQANLAYAQANSAYDAANGVSGSVNTTFATINTTFGGINTAITTANTQANVARDTANSAYAEANLKLNIAGGTITGNLVIQGNLEVLGNSTTLNVETLSVEDNEIILNSNVTGSPALDAFITINRGSDPNVSLKWNESINRWQWTDDGTNYYSLSTSLDAYGQANNAYGQANLAYDQANTARGTANDAYAQANAARDQANTAYGQANLAYAQANSAYAEANLKLNLTGGTISGSLNITQNLTTTETSKSNVFVSTRTALSAPTTLNFNGERVRLYDFNQAGRPNYAIGVEGNHIWMGVDDNGGTTGFKWYGNTTQVALLRTNSTFQVSNTVEAKTLRANGTGTAIDASQGNILTNQVTGTQFNFLNGLYTVNVRGAVTQTVDYTFRLPADGGTNGFVLVTDGSGNTSWSNAIYALANSAYDQANAARDQANTAYGQANNAYAQANDAYAQANTARDTGNSAYGQANSAYDQANAAYGQANTARNTANDAYGQANTARDQANTARNTANDAYGQANTARGTANDAYDQANAAYAQANTARGDANATFATINTAFGTLNTNISIANTQANVARDQANAARDQANAAYDTANLKLNIAGGTITGNLVISGNLEVLGNSTTLNVETLSVEDNEIILNSNVTGPAALDAYLTINRGSDPNVSLKWNESTNKWQWTDDGTNYYSFSTTLDAYSQANGAYDQANSAYGQANAAYGQANSAYSQANSAYAQANSAYGQANNAYGQANNAYAQANLAYSQANNAYTEANAAYQQADLGVTIAQNAYDKANSAANTVRVSGNSTSTQHAVSLNFINTASINVTVTSGETGSANIALSANTSNPEALGPQGPQGFQGVIGAQGSQGDVGAQGVQGAIGAQGAQGAQGVQGSQGPQGAQGAQGIQGVQGSTGPQGPTGSFGGASFDYEFRVETNDPVDLGSGILQFNANPFNTANTLYISFIDQNAANVYNFMQTIDDSTSTIKGNFKVANTANVNEYAFFNIVGNHVHDDDHFNVPIAYTTGSVTSFANTTNVVITLTRTGDKGDTGAQGPQGVQGVQGSQGPQGPQGVQGAVGAQGVQGDVGAQGAQGVIGAQGAQGIQGAVGAQGDVGAQGAQGVIGAQGPQGAQGAQGDVGSQGAQGTVGAQGVQGAVGAQGAQGVQGAVGAQGAQGAQGAVGAQGADGAQGAQGVVGAQGAQGVQGAVGPQGPQGVQGFNGTQGAQGAVGAQGAQGVQGATGPIGGSNTQIVFNNNGTADGSANLTFNLNQNLFAFGTSTLFANATSVQVGVGTINPTSNLHVVGNANITTGINTTTINVTTANVSTTIGGGSTLTIQPNVTIQQDLVVTGNLTVSGNSTTLNTETLMVEDADIVLLSNVTGSPVLNAGIIIDRGISANTFLRWNENDDKWGWSDDGTTFYAFADRVAKAGDTMTGQLNISSGGLFVTGVANVDELYVRSPGGDEGGEIKLANAITNQSLAGAVSIDVYQNKVRFFENGGAARGYFIDITQGTGGAGSPLFSNAGGTITGDTTFNGNVNFAANATMRTNTVTTVTQDVTVNVDAFATGTFRSALYQAQLARTSPANDYETITISVIHDGSTVYLSQYGQNKTNASANMGTFDAVIASGTLRLTFTPNVAVVTIKTHRSTMTV